jgi:hypothetical protein
MLPPKFKNNSLPYEHFWSIARGFLTGLTGCTRLEMKYCELKTLSHEPRAARRENLPLLSTLN